MPKQPPSILSYLNENGDELFYSWRITDEGGGFDVKASPEGSSASMQVQVAWADLNLARRVILGYPTVRYTPAGKPYVSRSLPLALPASVAAHPDDPASPLLWAKAITRTEGVGPRPPDALRWVRHRFARLTVSFTHPPYNIRSDGQCLAVTGDYAGYPDESQTVAGSEPIRYARRLFEPLERVVSLPTQLTRFVLESGDDGFPLKAGPPLLDAYGLPEPGTVIKLTIFERSDLPLLTLMSLVGTSNAAAFAGFPAETMTMLAPTIRSYVGGVGFMLYDITVGARFISKFRPGTPGTFLGPNYYLKVLPSGAVQRVVYRQLTTTGFASGDVMVRSADWNKVWFPEA